MCRVTCLHATATGFSCTTFSAAPGTSSIIILAPMCFAPLEHPQREAA